MATMASRGWFSPSSSTTTTASERQPRGRLPAHRGHGFDNIAGSLEVREFTGSEDPLDPGTDTGDPIATDTVTGRRVKARG